MAFDVDRFTGAGKPVEFDPILFGVLALCLGGFVFYGAYSAIGLAATLELPLSPVLMAVVPLIGAIFASMITYGFLHTVHNYGTEGVFLYAGLFSSLMYSGLLIIYPGLNFGVGLIWGILLFIFFIALWVITGHARERAKRFIKSVIDVMMEENSLILPTFIFFIASAYLCFSYAGILFDFGLIRFVPEDMGHSIEVNNLPFLLISIFFFVYVQQVLFLFLMGIVAAMTYIWYRGADPKLNDGIRLVMRRIDPITEFSLYCAFFHTLAATLFVFGKMGVKIATVMMQILWGVVNYFTLQTVVITGRRPPQAIKLSTRLLVNNIPDVLVKEIFVDSGIRLIFEILSMPVYAIGIALFFISGDAMISVLFIYSAGLIFGVFSYTMNHVYRTFLFAWALEKEFGKDTSSRIPPGIQQIIGQIQYENQDNGLDRLIRKEKGGGESRTPSHGTDWSYITKTRMRRP